MRSIINFAVKNPVTILMMVLAIMLLGKISYDQLSVDLLPNLNNPRLFVEIEAGERPPEEIEKQFVKSMESMAVRQSDVVSVSSVIKAGSARITVEYSWGKDMDEAFLDLQKAMNSFTQNQDLDELTITQHDPNTDPVILVGLSHQSITDMAEIRKVAESYIRNELVRLEGVADVTLSGEEVSDLVIKTDQYKLDAFGITIETLTSKINENNQRISGGRVSELGQQYIVQGVNMLTDISDFENLIVGYKPINATSTSTTSSTSTSSTEASAPIFLKDIATVSFENKRPDNIVRINGTRCIGLSVFKEMRYNTVKVAQNVTEKLTNIEKALPGYHFNVISNQATFINSAIGEVKESAILGIILAVIVLYLFLRRAGITLIIATSIPISIIATFNLMFFNDLSLNIMSLGGLALGAGMLIDNAIVVIESIFRNREKGLSVREAAITGTSEVATAVSASTLTTIVVFLPIVYLHGASGALFKDQAWTVAFSLLSSLFVAILVIPTFYDSVFGKKKKIEKESFKSVQVTGYGNFLRNILKRKTFIISASVGLVIFSICLLPFIGMEFMPRAEGKAFSITVKLPEGTKLERTASTIDNLEQLLYTISGDSLCTIYTHSGEGSGSDNAIFEGENTGVMKVILSENAPFAPETVISKFLEATESIDGLELAFKNEENSLSSLLGTEGAPIVVEVKGEELEDIARITEEVKERMTNIKGLYNIVTSIENGAPELLISVNRTLAGMNNISVATIVQQIQQQLEGSEAGQMEYRGEMRDIIIKVPDINRFQLNSLIIKNGSQEFRLQEIATITPASAPKEILHRNQDRIANILADLEKGESLDKVANEIRTAVSDIELPTNCSITVSGEEEKRQESMNSLMFALALSVILVYMVMASQFESLLHPFTILLTIPVALVGAVILFWLTGTTINIMGVIGIVMLSGIAVNNAIILVDRINQLKASGMDLTDAIVEAGQQRIRPIIMTSLTTILALLPMAFTFGDGGSLRSPMAIAVIGGLVTSTALSLILIPCVYDVFERMKNAFSHKMEKR
ncbi:MAG: efflux RND transporter permease subunit [Bacteroidaceae bacterium]|nr:efflux RND transporter permease subunit [Bacteroidaceae bacterium]